MPSGSESALAIRRAGLSEAAEIARAHLQAWRDAYPEILPQAVLDRLSLETREAAWGRLLTQPEQAAWVVRDGDAVVGFASLGPSEDPAEDRATAELSAMYLLAGYWGRGLGRQLMGLVFDELIRRGFDQAVLWVLEDNTRARRFYEAAGWFPDGGRKDHFGGAEAMAVRYRIVL
jgi:GNAT superfamily N-acetyltransferase